MFLGKFLFQGFTHASIICDYQPKLNFDTFIYTKEIKGLKL